MLAYQSDWEVNEFGVAAFQILGKTSDTMIPVHFLVRLSSLCSAHSKLDSSFLTDCGYYQNVQKDEILVVSLHGREYKINHNPSGAGDLNPNQFYHENLYDV